MMEEHEILKSAIREFVQKSIEPEALNIERNGISPDLRKAMGAQGFLGARVDSSLGGSELDETGYTILLDELARASPSVAVDVMLMNSFFYPLASLSEDGKKSVREILSSGAGISVVLNDILEGYIPEGDLEISGPAINGKREKILNRNASSAVLLTKHGRIVLVDDAKAFTPQEYSLGFRGLGMSSMKLSGSAFTTLLEKNGKEKMEKVMNASDLAVAAIALGMTSGALLKGIDYSRVRKTFGQSLKDYQPVAFTLASLRSEEEMLRTALYSQDLDEEHRLMLKTRALDLAKRASKYALQVHGGYGYFEDFGVEKFYRDSTSLAGMFSRSVKDMERLSHFLYGEKSGFL